MPGMPVSNPISPHTCLQCLSVSTPNVGFRGCFYLHLGFGGHGGGHSPEEICIALSLLKRRNRI